MKRRLVDALTNDLLLKLTAIGLAFLLWTTVKTPDPVAIDGIPVRVIVGDVGWALAGDPDPATVTVEFSGPLRQLVRLATERPPIIVSVDQVTDSIQTVQLRGTALTFGPGTEDTRVEAIRPLLVTLRFDRIIARTVPLAFGLVGAPAPGFELAAPVTLDPAMVRISGPTRVVDRIDTLRLEAVDLTQRTDTDTLMLAIEGLPREVAVEPMEVRVIIPIRPVASDSGGAVPDTTPGPAGGRRERGPGLRP